MPILLRWVNCRFRSASLRAGLLALLLMATACSGQNRTVKQITEDGKDAGQSDTSLTFNAVTLEEFDKKGRLWWKVKAAQASYSRDKKTAEVQKPTGEFFQDGKSVLKVSAQRGEVRQDGQTILLRGQIVATDTRDGAVLKGEELEWRPKEDIVILRKGLNGSHKNLVVAAKEGTFLTRARRIELKGQVMAEAKDPTARFRSEQVIWQVNQQTLATDRPLQIDRLVNNQVTDRAVANAGFIDLKAKTASLKQNAQVLVQDPPVQIASNILNWNLNSKTVSTDQGITLVNQQQQVTLTANQGRMEIASKTLFLEGNVQGVSNKNQATVRSDRLTWFSESEQFEADGNVFYQQVSPAMNLRGPRATGRLQDQMVVVSGGNSGGRVVTQFIPEQVGNLGR